MRVSVSVSVSVSVNRTLYISDALHNGNDGPDCGGAKICDACLRRAAARQATPFSRSMAGTTRRRERARRSKKLQAGATRPNQEQEGSALERASRAPHPGMATRTSFNTPCPRPSMPAPASTIRGSEHALACSPQHAKTSETGLAPLGSPLLDSADQRSSTSLLDIPTGSQYPPPCRTAMLRDQYSFIHSFIAQL